MQHEMIMIAHYCVSCDINSEGIVKLFQPVDGPRAAMIERAALRWLTAA
jgi:hypothetical protein